MSRLKFEGGWTALVTPFTEEKEIDWEGFRKNIEFQVSQGISGILPVGTTGEFPTLSWEEHVHVIDSAQDIAQKRCVVIAGTGSNSTEETLKATEEAKKAGVESVLLVDCYYNCPSSLELRKEYYERVAKAYPEIYIMPYIIPGRTGTILSAEDLAILSSECPNVCAVKEATGDLEHMARIRELIGDDFDILSGDDDLTFKMMLDPRIKASGVISVISNIAPAAVEEMTRKILAGEQAEARVIQEALQPLFELVTVKCKDERILLQKKKMVVEDKFRNPLPIKTLMNGLGMSAGPCRPPLGKMTCAGVKIVRNAAKLVWQESPQILRPIEETYEVDIEERLVDDACWDTLAYE